MAIVLLAAMAPAQDRPGRTAVLVRFMEDASSLRNPSVQEELKLSDEQRQQLPAVQREGMAAIADADAAQPPDAAAQRTAAASIDPRLLKLLTPEQATRFRQIVWQRQKLLNGLVAVLRDPEFAGPLQLTPEQTTTLQNEEAEFARLGEAQRQAFAARRAGEVPQAQARAGSLEVTRKLLDFRRASEIRLTAMLSADQRSQMKQLLGAAFRPEVESAPRPPSPNAALPAPNARLPAPLPGVFERLSSLAALAPLVLAEPSVQQELRLSDEQTRQIRAEGVERALAAQPLAPDQQMRLRQVYLRIQRRELGPRAVLRYTEVADALKLSEMQQGQIEEILRRSFAPATLSRGLAARFDEEEQQILQQVLSAEQQTAWKDLLGEPFEGLVTQRSPWPLEVSLTTSLSVPSVQQELRLTEAQVREVAERAAQPRAQREPLADVLSREQLQRLREVHLQIELQSGPLALLRIGEVADPLHLSAAQWEQIRAIRSPAEFSRGLSAEDQAAAARLAADEFRALLSAEQQATLTALLGEPFRGDLPPRRLPAALQPPPR
jgi:hypothetical protein